MSQQPMKLYVFALSPYAHKVAAILDFKKLPYTPAFVHPLKKTEIPFSRRKQIPILDDGGEIVEDSTEIALYLEGRCPEPQTIPDDRRARAEVFAIERWLDDVFFGKFYVSVMFGSPANRERTIQAFLDTTAFTSFERRFLPLVAPIQLRHTIAQAQLDQYRLPQFLDDFETRLGTGPFLGSQPQVSLADLSAFGALSVITDLQFEGAEMLRERRSIQDWLEAMRPQTSPGSRLLRS